MTTNNAHQIHSVHILWHEHVPYSTLYHEYVICVVGSAIAIQILLKRIKYFATSIHAAMLFDEQLLNSSI